MSLSVNTNVASLFSQRMLASANNNQSTAMERLSSGLRINSAKDDAAGLAISTGFSTQINGATQAIRNVNDGIAVLQTGDAALDSIVTNLQRIRELAVQSANGIYSELDRSFINTEVTTLKNEIDQISSSTTFNGNNLFERGKLPGWVDSDRQFNVDQLFGNWLAESERMIEEQFGLKADGAENLSIVFDDDLNSEFAATVSYNAADDDDLSRATNQVLTLYTKSFPGENAPNGGSSPVFSDRIIAHEMVHAVMGRTMDMDSLEEWFKEGAAELIQGADESVLNQLRAEDDTTTHFSTADVASYAADTAFFGAWDSSGKHYSQGYLAVRYMHEDIVANGGEGIKDVMAFLSDEDNLANGLTTLDDALVQLNTDGLTSFTGDTSGVNDFRSAYAADATNFIQTLNFSNEDTGAIGGLDVDGGEVKTAESVVDNSNTFLSLNPLEGYNNVEVNSSGVVNPMLAQNFNLQVGAGHSDSLELNFFQVNSDVLGMNEIDLSTIESSSEAITLVDRALGYISDQRAHLGANANRLANTVSINEITNQMASLSRSRIQDADFATESTQLAKSQLLHQTSTSILAQANASNQRVLSLLG